MKTLHFSAVLCSLALCCSTAPAHAAFTGKKPVAAPKVIVPGINCKQNLIFDQYCVWPKYNLRFKAPLHADVFEHDTDRQALVMLGSQNDTLKAQGIPSFAITIDVKDHLTEISLGQMDAEFQKNANYMYKNGDVRAFGDFKLIEKTETTFMTFPAIRYVYEANADNMTFKYIDYHAIKGVREYRAMFRSAPKYYDDTKDMFEVFAKYMTLNTAPSTIADPVSSSSSSRTLSRSSRSASTTKRTSITSGSRRSSRASSASSK